MSLLETDRLSELVAKKHELLVQMRDLGRLQMEFIEADDYTQLLKVLSAKQRILSALQMNERELQHYRGQDPEARQWRSALERQQCAELMRKAEAVFHEIVDQEKQGETQLLLRRNDAAARLNGVHSASQARGAYMTDVAPARAYLDLSSS